MADDALRTDLFIGGEWRPAADGGERFDVFDPGTEEVIASVASAGAADAARRGRRGRGGTAGVGRRRRHASAAEVLRRSWELLTERADDLARLITLENGKVLAEAKGEITYAAEFFRWFSEEAVRLRGELTTAPGRRQPHPRPAPAGGRGLPRHAVELPRRDGHPQDRAGAGRRVRRRPQAGHAHTAHRPGGGRRPRTRRACPAGVVNVVPGPQRQHDHRGGARAPAGAQAVLHGLDRGGQAAASSRPPGGCSTRRWSWAATPRSSCWPTPTSTPPSRER